MRKVHKALVLYNYAHSAFELALIGFYSVPMGHSCYLPQIHTHSLSSFFSLAVGTPFVVQEVHVEKDPVEKWLRDSVQANQ